MRIKLGIGGLAVLLASGCGYRLANRQVTLPGGATELAVPLAKNETFEAGLEAIVTQELRRQLLADGRIGLDDGAGVELRAVIVDFNRTAMSLTEFGRVSVERAAITAEFRLVQKPEGNLLWSSGPLAADEEYPVAADPLAVERDRERAEREVAKDLADSALQLLLDDF